LSDFAVAKWKSAFQISLVTQGGAVHGVAEISATGLCLCGRF